MSVLRLSERYETILKMPEMSIALDAADSHFLLEALREKEMREQIAQEIRAAKTAPKQPLFERFIQTRYGEEGLFLLSIASVLVVAWLLGP